MITVRFETGFSIQYNSATIVYTYDAHSNLYTKAKENGGVWVAQVPNSAVIEAVGPCRLHNPIATGSDEAQSKLDQLVREVRLLKRKVGKAAAK